MLEFHYTAEKNVQIVVALLKKYGIRRIVASPGATNVTFVVSVQFDPFFEVYSCVDERSAAYMACGIADETGEPVALSCTGATSSRNYILRFDGGLLQKAACPCNNVISNGLPYRAPYSPSDR